MEDFTFANAVQKLNTGRINLLDADYIKYIVCSRRHKEIEFYEQNKNVVPMVEESPIIRLTDDFLATSIFGKIEDPIIFCWSGKSYNTFRNHICIEKKYKSGRNKEENYPGESADSMKVAEYIMSKYISLLFEDLEADDVVSALQGEDTYIMSKDKDLKQVPGMHYDFASNKIYEITKQEAAYNLAYQLLAGDSTDNIGGFPKIGKKKAKAFLDAIVSPREYVLRVAKLYQDNFGIFIGTDMFVETWNLVKMRENRGEHFKLKYLKMFDVKEYVKRNSLK